MFVLTCPLCGFPQIADSLVDGDRSVTCPECEATWEQRGSRQRHVVPGNIRGVPRRSRRGLMVFPQEE